MAWAHYVGWTVPARNSFEPQHYYNYPVFENAGDPFRAEVRRALAAGLDGFFVDVIMQYRWRPGYHDTVERLLAAAEDTPFRVAPCLDVKTDVTNQVDNICWMLDRFGNHPNYPRVNEKYVLATYTYPEWTPTQWRWMLDRCAAKGFPLYLVGNVKYSCGVLRPERLENYRDVFDVCYGFAYIGGETWSIDRECRSTAAWCKAHGKRYMACLHPGYFARWLRGGNAGYQAFRGLDQYLDCFSALRETGADWIHFTTWNDHCETTLEPMTLTPGNGALLRATCDAFKGQRPTARAADVLFAYHREELPGTLLRFEALRLPAAETNAVTVSGTLQDAFGRAMATLPPRTLAAAWDRAEWLVPSTALAKSPHLVPVFTRASPAETRTARLPALLFRTPWLENNITVRAAFGDCGEKKHSLRVSEKGGVFTATLGLSGPGTVKRAILFRNERPLGQFRAVSQKPGAAGLPILFAGNCQVDLALPDGEVVKVFRGGRPFGQDGFRYTDHAIDNRPNGAFENLSAWLEASPDAVVTFADAGGPRRFTLPELARLRRLSLRNGSLTLQAYPDCTLREMPCLDAAEGSFRLAVYDRPPRPQDAFYARLELQNGRMVETDVLYPFAAGDTVCTTLLETPVTLETKPGDLGLPRIEPLVVYREFLTPETNLPVRTTTPVAADVARASLREAFWPLAGDGLSAYDDRHLTIATNLFTHEGGRTALRFTGSERVSLPARMAPMDAGSVSFDIAPEPPDGTPRTVLGRLGYGTGFTARLLGDGRLETHWSGTGRGGVWKITPAVDLALVTPEPLPPRAWTRVTLANDNRTLRIFLDGRCVAARTYTPFRSYGPAVFVLGGEGQDAPGYRGRLTALRLAGSEPRAFRGD